MNNIPAIATEQVEGLHLRCINEIYYFDPEVRLRGRYVGIVLKVIKDDKYMSFVSLNLFIQSVMAAQPHKSHYPSKRFNTK